MVGLHYCVVINKNDNPYSGTLNILPLSSAKIGKEYNSTTCIELGDELYSLLYNKFKKESKKLKEKVVEFKVNQNLDSESSDSNIKKLLKKLDYLEMISKEISKMKHGSVVYIHQITTISKQRVFRLPILSGIKLSNKSLDLIDEKIIKLYTK